MGRHGGHESFFSKRLRDRIRWAEPGEEILVCDPYELREAEELIRRWGLGDKISVRYEDRRGYDGKEFIDFEVE